MVKSTIKISFFLLIWFLMICFLDFGIAYASSLKIHVRDSLIDIKADKVSLFNVLSSLSQKTELTIKSTASLKELVSCDLEKLNLEQTIRHLMANKNCSIYYFKNKDGKVLLGIIGENKTEQIITGNDTTEQTITTSKNKKTQIIKEEENVAYLEENISPVSSDDFIKEYKRSWFKKNFRDKKDLSKEVAIYDRNDFPSPMGIRIKKVSKDSPFSKIGIKEGDVIKDVNGTPITNVAEFVNTLSSPVLPPMIRINREEINEAGGEHSPTIKPIYININ